MDKYILDKANKNIIMVKPFKSRVMLALCKAEVGLGFVIFTFTIS